MSGPHLERMMASWNPEGQPWTIEYSWELMEAIRAAALDGLFRIARGGIEIGGVLFGERKGQVIRIRAARQLPCQYSTGPSFILSPIDRENLAHLLADARVDPELEGMTAVGWYHSHTRSGLELSPEDIEIYETFFPERWQVSLVVKPERIDPTRGTFFVRGKDGQIAGPLSDGEFVMDPPARRSRKRRLAESGEEPEAAVDRPDDDISAGPPIRKRTEQQWSDWLVFSVALLLFLGGAVQLIWPVLKQGTLQPLTLLLLDHGGQLEVRWDGAPARLSDASGGTLEIQDGAKRVEIRITAAELRRGNLTYARQSGEVKVTLQVQQTGREPAEAIARFVGTAPPVEMPKDGSAWPAQPSAIPENPLPPIAGDSTTSPGND